MPARRIGSRIAVAARTIAATLAGARSGSITTSRNRARVVARTIAAMGIAGKIIAIGLTVSAARRRVLGKATIGAEAATGAEVSSKNMLKNIDPEAQSNNPRLALHNMIREGNTPNIFKTLGTRRIKAGTSEASLDPIDVSSGNYYIDQTDMIIHGVAPLVFKRFYNALDDYDGILGKNWHHNYQIKLDQTEEKINITWGDGRREEFSIQEDGKITSDDDPFQTIEKTEEGIYIIQTANGEIYNFDVQGYLTNIISSTGSKTTLTYDKNLLTKIESKSGYIKLYYNRGLLYKITDNAGRKVEYIHQKRKLIEVGNINKGKTKYSYDSNNKITQVTDPNGNIMIENKYDDENRVAEQTMPMGIWKGYLEYDDVANTTTLTERNDLQIIYQKDKENRIIEKHTIAGVKEYKEKMEYNNEGLISSYTDKNGGKYQYTHGQIVTMTNPLGETTEIGYDEIGLVKYEKYPDGSMHQYSHTLIGQLETYTDPLGAKTQLIYDVEGNLITIVLPDGSQRTFTYDKKGNPITYKDGEGNTTELTYDEINRIIAYTKPEKNKTNITYNEIDKITQIEHPNGNKRKRIYDYCGLLTKETDEAGGITQYEYLPTGKPAQKTDPLGNITKYEYDIMDNLIAIIQADGTQKQYSYDKMGNRRVEEDEEGHERRYIYDGNGNIIQEIDPEDNSTHYKYDALNRLIKETDAQGNTTTYEYRYDGKLLKVTDAARGVTENKYDLMGRLISRINPLGAETKYEYNEMGYLVKEINPYGAETIYDYNKNGKIIQKTYPDGTKEQAAYDSNNNLIKHTDQDGNETIYEYDNMDRVNAVINALGGKKTYTYNPVGKLATITDENDNITSYEYDLNQNLTKVTNALGYSTIYKYDVMNRLTEIHQKNRCLEKPRSIPVEKDLVTIYHYNLRGDMIAEVNAKNQVTYHRYDANGNLIGTTDRDGYITQHEYDAINNLVKIKHGVGTEKETVTTYKNDPMGRVISMLDALGETTYERDILGRIIQITDPNNKKVKYQWGLLNERKSLTYPDGKTVFYTHDIMGRIQKVNTAEGEEVVYEYNPVGTIAKEILPNGQSTEYGYDPLHQIISLKHYSKPNHKNEQYLLDSREYSYDKSGRKIGMKIENSKQVEGATTVYGKPSKEIGYYRYTYDKIDRVVEVITPKTGETYTYDNLGNRIKKSIRAGGTTEYYHDELNQLIQIKGPEEKLLGHRLTEGLATLEYDRRGNMINIQAEGKSLAEYEYNPANRLARTITHMGTTASYIYDGTGRRKQKEINGSTYDYIVDITTPYNDILTVDHKGEQTAYIYGNKRIGSYTKREETEDILTIYHLHDEMGSLIRTTNPEGERVSKIMPDVFGRTAVEKTTSKRIPIANTHDLLGFTGYENDGDTGLMFVQARYYMPEIGRFVEQDPYKGNIFIPHSLNGYDHCYNNPLMYVDMDGCMPSSGLPASVASYMDRNRFDGPTDNTYNNYTCPENRTLREILAGWQNNDEWLWSGKGYSPAQFRNFEFYPALGRISTSIGSFKPSTDGGKFSIEGASINMEGSRLAVRNMETDEGWGVTMFNAKADAAITSDLTGFNAGVSGVKSDEVRTRYFYGRFNTYFYFGAHGEIYSASVRAYFTQNRIRAGFAWGYGGSVFIGWKQVEGDNSTYAQQVIDAGRRVVDKVHGN